VHYFEPNEIVALLQAAYNRNRVHHMIMLVSVAHGLRVSDAIALESGDVQSTSLAVNRNRLKDNGEQLQPLHFSDNPIFDERSLVIHAGQIAGDSALKDKRLFHLCRQRCDQLIRRYGKEANIPTAKLHWHSLRHSTAMLTWSESHSLSQVQRVLGHKNQSTSLIYLHESDRAKGLLSLRRGLEAIADCSVTQLSTPIRETLTCSANSQ
jgi:integrase/recombinase XerD